LTQLEEQSGKGTQEEPALVQDFVFEVEPGIYVKVIDLSFLTSHGHRLKSDNLKS
jgi:hypothetical protein